MAAGCDLAGAAVDTGGLLGLASVDVPEAVVFGSGKDLLAVGD
jgi:hypothetical protein